MSTHTIYTCRNLFDGTDERTRNAAFVVIDGRIDAVGPLEKMQEFSSGAPVVDFGDAFLCPGFHDSHLHFFHSALYSSPLALRYCGTSEADCIAALEPLAQSRPAGSWLLCQGWRENHWNPSVTPSRASLDAAYPDRPVAMYSGDGHTLWLNSCALEELGIDDSSQPPSGGSYDRDREGRLTGIVREAAAMELMPKIVSSFAPEEVQDAYAGFLAHAASRGVTSVCDMSLMAAPGLDFVRDDVYAALLESERLTCRVHLFPTLLDDFGRFEDMKRSYTGDMLRACGLKQFFDGVSSQHTAWLAEPYTNARFDGDCGRPTVEVERMRAMVLAAHEKGYPVRIHTIGDAAIHAALDFFEEARTLYGPLPQGLHHCLEHMENFQPADIARVAELDIVAACQPIHITLDPGAPEADLGPQRVPYMWPFASLLGSGATLAFGTDSPVCAIEPMPGLYTAVTRKTIPDGQPEGGWVPAERISMAQALRAYTAGSAAACGRASELGTIEAGKLADFVVLDRNLLTCSEDEILQTEVVATYVGGACVYENPTPRPKRANRLPNPGMALHELSRNATSRNPRS